MNEEFTIKEEDKNIVIEKDKTNDDEAKKEDNSKSKLLAIVVILIGLFIIYLYYNGSNSSSQIGTIADISFIYQLSQISFSDIIVVIYLILINSKLKQLLKK